MQVVVPVGHGLSAHISRTIVEQLMPSKPNRHVQLYPLTRSVHVPPLAHGALAQSS